MLISGVTGRVFVLVFVLMIAGLTPSAGCSWIFVRPLPADYESGDRVDCTSNRTAPVVDTIFTATNLAASIYVAGKDNVANKGDAVFLGISEAVVWLSSAIYGYSKTSACEDAIEDARTSPRYLPPRRLRSPREFFPSPPMSAAPSPSPSPPALPASATPVVPQRSDDEDDPSDRRDTPASRRPPPFPQKLDAPRFGN